MSTTYAGDPTSYPATITVLDDGDVPEAASLAPAIEGLADRTAYLAGRAAVAFGFVEVTLPRAADTVTGNTWTLVNASAICDFTGLQAGDRILFEAAFEHRSSLGLVESQVRIEVDGPGTDYAGAHAVNATTTNANASRIGQYVVDTAGDHDVKLMHRASTAGDDSIVTHFQLRAFVYRATS